MIVVVAAIALVVSAMRDNARWEMEMEGRFEARQRNAEYKELQDERQEAFWRRIKERREPYLRSKPRGAVDDEDLILQGIDPEINKNWKPEED